MLPNCVFIAISVIFDTDPFEIAFFEYTVLYEIFTIKPANSLKCVIEMLADTDDTIFFQDEAIAFSFVEAFLISEKTFLA